MEHTKHVLLVSDGAAAFAGAHGLARVEQPERYYVRVQNGLPGAGTIGAVARDQSGRLAAATSTGGTTNKMPGRIGDSPLIGAGCWADGTAAVSCTGIGEYFIRSNAAADVSARMRYGGQSLRDAGDAVIKAVQRLGGQGGLIAIDSAGELTTPFCTQGMKRGWITSAGAREVRSLG